MEKIKMSDYSGDILPSYIILLMDKINEIIDYLKEKEDE